MFTGGLKQSSSRSAVVIAAILWLLAGPTAEFEHTAPPRRDTAHSTLTSSTGAVAVNGDPTHLNQFPALKCPKAFDTTILPRLVPGLIALWTGALTAVIARWDVGGMPQSGRSPPSMCGIAITGRDLLSRLCIARR